MGNDISNGKADRGEAVTGRLDVVPTPELKYFGGKILRDPHVTSVYLGSYWHTQEGRTDRRYLDGFAKALFKGPHMKLWGQYGINKGTFDGSSVIGAVGSPNLLTQRQLEALLRKGLKEGHIKAPSDQSIVSLFLPPGTVLQADGVSSLDGMGGYHSCIADEAGHRVYYAAMVYSKGANGIDFNGEPRDNVSITASHEWTEAATDPDVNHGKLGWYDENYGEVGDIPINLGLPLKDLFERMGKYAVQKEWSNIDGRSEVAPAS